MLYLNNLNDKRRKGSRYAVMNLERERERESESRSNLLQKVSCRIFIWDEFLLKEGPKAVEILFVISLCRARLSVRQYSVLCRITL